MITTNRKKILEHYSEEDLARCAEVVTKARMRIVVAHRFLSTLVLRLPCVPAVGSTSAGEFTTAATEGNNIYYNPEFFLDLEQRHVEGVLVHELMHCILEHHLRRGSRHPLIWNLACDYVINPILEDDFNFRLPSDRIRETKYDGKNAEAVYELLLKEMPIIKIGNVGEGDGSSSDGHKDSQQEDYEQQQVQGQVLDAKEVDEAPGDGKQAENWPGIAAAAAQQAKMQGDSIPSFIERTMNLNQKADNAWLTALYQYFTPSKVDHSWKRSDRRFLAQGIYLPALAGEQIEHAIVIEDSSGSISPDELGLFNSAILGVVSETRPKLLTVLGADTHVRNMHQYTEADYPIKAIPPPEGGGGTSFVDALQKAKTIGPVEPTVVIYLTDGYGEFGDPPPYPILWVCTTDVVAPFGETVQLRAI